MLGTPNEESWPGVKQLADYKPTFPQWSAQDLAEQVPYLDEAGIDLLKVMNCSPFLICLAESMLTENSKLSHTTAPGAFLQNVRLCTHTSLIIVDSTKYLKHPPLYVPPPPFFPLPFNHALPLAS